MQVFKIKNPGTLKKKFRKPVVTIGVFDGVHLGHQEIITQVVRKARIIKGTSIVITFFPHPSSIFKKSLTAPLITSLEHRINIIGSLGVDICMVFDFHKKFAQMTAEDFVKDILVEIIDIHCLIVGEKFHFGKKREGSFELLQKMSFIYDFELQMIKPIKKDKGLISSSRIRRLIQDGRLDDAEKLLGREFSILGTVKKGSRRGKFLGYPTANIAVHHEVIPPSGVYVVRVRLGRRIMFGILNIGCRPTFQEETTGELVEVHIFNFSQSLYGRKIEIFFIQKLRPEKRFASHQDLVAQIKEDEHQARRILQSGLFPKIYP